MTPDTDLPASQRMRAIAAILIAIALATLDSAIANTALPTIGADLGVTPAQAVWIVNAYQLAIVGTLLPIASLGDAIGHRRVHLFGVTLFIAASLMCALAPSLTVLLAGRVCQGLGASAIMAANVALVRFIYPEHQLGRGVGLNALAVGISFAIGPTIASAILLVAHWPWLFAVNVPVGLIGLWASFALPATPRSKHGVDPFGSLLAVAALTSFALAIDEVAHGALGPRVAVEALLVVACGTAVWRRQRNHPAPLLAVDLFRRPAFTLTALTSICTFAGQGLAFVSLPFLFQHGLGRTPVETGFLMTPWPVAVALMAPVAGPLSDRISPGLLGGVGLALLGAGMALLALLPPSPSALDIGWRMALSGLGFGFFQAPNMRAFLTSAPAGRAGGVSGVASLTRLTGQNTGAALVAGCLAWSSTRGPELALGLGAAFALVAACASLLRLGAPRPAA